MLFFFSLSFLWCGQSDRLSLRYRTHALTALADAHKMNCCDHKSNRSILISFCSYSTVCRRNKKEHKFRSGLFVVPMCRTAAFAAFSFQLKVTHSALVLNKS